MQVEDYFEFIQPDYIRIKGHRLGIEHVLDYYKDGYKAEEITRELPSLSLDKVEAAIAYYWQHRKKMDGYLIRWEQSRERDYQEWMANLPPYSQRLRRLMAQRRYENSLSIL